MSTPPSTPQVTFSVRHVAAWAPGLVDEAAWRTWALGDMPLGVEGVPDLKWMPPLLRRHAGPLGRLACDVGFRAADAAADMPIVFGSRYGDVQRSVDLLTALARHEPLSPTAFSLSVHNAIVGLFAMARADRANAIAIAAGDETVEAAALEACALLADGAERVLLVLADCPLPPIYTTFADTVPAMLAWACVVEPPKDHVLTLARDHAGPAATHAPPRAGAEAVLRFLLGDTTQLHRPGRHGGWRWSRAG